MNVQKNEIEAARRASFMKQKASMVQEEKELIKAEHSLQRKIPAELKEKHKELTRTYKVEMRVLSKNGASRKERQEREKQLKIDRRAADAQAKADLEASKKRVSEWKKNKPQVVKEKKNKGDAKAAEKKKKIEEEYAPKLSKLQADDKNAEGGQAKLKREASRK